MMGYNNSKSNMVMVVVVLAEPGFKQHTCISTDFATNRAVYVK